MDTTIGNENIRYRAIESAMIHHRIYWFIITMEVTYTVLCLIGAYQLFRNINAPAEMFHEAKKILDHGHTGGNIHLLRLPANHGCGVV